MLQAGTKVIQMYAFLFFFTAATPNMIASLFIFSLYFNLIFSFIIPFNAFGQIDTWEYVIQIAFWA